jgi:hypothetical protein
METTVPEAKRRHPGWLPIALAALMGATSSAAADEPFAIIRPFGSPDNAVVGLGGIQLAAADNSNAPSGEEVSGPKWKGYSQGEFAYTYASPAHWSKLKGRLEVEVEGRFSEQARWKLSGGAFYDAVFDVTDFYPGAVAHDQRSEFIARENYLDYSAGDFDFRFGRQHIVWGEVVGLFFADVVSAKDLREFILPDFDLIRIPQWAARVEYFKNDFHAEAMWIPVMSYDKIGKPGAEFFPYPPPPPAGFGVAFEDEVRPSNNASNGAYGGRMSYLKNGWDGSVFYYRSFNASPTFYRQIVTAPTPLFVYQPRHDRIWQAGATLAKDFSDYVLKVESVYTAGAGYNVTRLADDDGVVKQDTFEYIASLDVPFGEESRFNVQFFQRFYRDHDPDIIPKRVETGASVFMSTKLTPALSAEVLLVSSLNRTDWMLRPKLVWGFAPNWRLAAGIDAFGGSPTGLFGQFNARDRVYTEVRYSF